MTSEEENTFRALKGENLLVTSFWCRLGLHRWTKWEVVLDREGWGNSYVIQRKTCVHCNDFTERKKKVFQK